VIVGIPGATVPGYQRSDVVKEQCIPRRSGRKRDTNPFASRAMDNRSGLKPARTRDTPAR